MRLSHAATDVSNAPRFAGISRVDLSPNWWHPSQPSVLVNSIHSPWSLMRSEMPFPFGPVPGKSLFGRIVLRRFLRARSDDRLQIQWLAWGGLNLRRIHQTITAHPNRVVRRRFRP